MFKNVLINNKKSLLNSTSIKRFIYTKYYIKYGEKESLIKT